jgi:hypothetical protein
MPARLPPGRERRWLLVACQRDGLGFVPPALEGDAFRSQDGRGSVARGRAGALGDCTRFATPFPCVDVANRFRILNTVTELSAKITRIRSVGVAFSILFICKPDRGPGAVHVRAAPQASRNRPACLCGGPKQAGATARVEGCGAIAAGITHDLIGVSAHGCVRGTASWKRDRRQRAADSPAQLIRRRKTPAAGA